MSLHSKITISYSQQYPWNLYLINNIEYMFSCSRNAQITFGEKPQIKIISFQNCTHEYLIHTWTEKSFKGTIVNRALSSLHKGSPAVTLTVSIKDRGKIIFSLSLSLSLSPSLSLPFPFHFPFTFPFTFPSLSPSLSLHFSFHFPLQF